MQDAVRKTQGAVRKRVTRLARSFYPNPNPDRSVRLQLKRRIWQEDRSVRLQLKRNILATLRANEGRVRSRPRLQRNRSELCKAQCSRRAMQIRTSVRAFCKARVRARDAARKRVTRSVTAQVVAQQKRTVQGAVFPMSDAYTSFCPSILNG